MVRYHLGVCCCITVWAWFRSVGGWVASVILLRFRRVPLHVSSLIPTPQEFVSQLNQLLFQFLWNGPDKVTRRSAINEYSDGGLKIIDFDSMIISLRLAWLKRIVSSNDGTWKRYLTYHLERFGSLFLFQCNYDVSILPLNISLFYLELLQWWSEFRDMFCSEKDWRYILWNNKQILLIIIKQFIIKAISKLV